MVQGTFLKKLRHLKWDQAKLWQIDLIDEQKMEDAFMIRQVPDDLVFNVTKIAGFLPLFQRYVATRPTRELTSVEALTLARDLNELDAFMYENRLIQKRRQKQLRSLGIVDVLIRMLEAPFKDGQIKNYDAVSKPEHNNTQMVMVNVFRVLQSFLKGNCRKNEMYMCQFAPFLWELYGTNMKVEPMFNELVRDNRKVIQCVTIAEVERIVGMLHGDDGKNPDYLEFLTVLCVCDGAPIRRYQAIVGQVLLMGTVKERGQAALFLTEVRSMPGCNQKEVRVSVTGNPQDEIPLETFALSALDEDDRTSSEEYLFLQRQLDLFGKLCLGRMEQNIKLITVDLGYLTFEECFMCMQARSETRESAQQRTMSATRSVKSSTMFLPRSLRKIYVDLMVNLFVDVGNNQDVLSHVELNFSWDELSRDFYDNAATDQKQALSGATMERFPDLKGWIHSQLDQVKCMIHKDQYNGQAFNRLLASTLNLLHHLVRFGYYASGDDISMMMEPLEGVISGFNDRREEFSDPEANKAMVDESRRDSGAFDEFTSDFQLGKIHAEWLQNGRYEMDDDGLAVMEAKTRALMCIESLFNHVFNVRMRFLLADFKDLMEGRDAGSPGVEDDNFLRALLEEKLSFANELAKPVGKKNGDNRVRPAAVDMAKLTREAREYLKQLSKDTNWVNEQCDPGWTIADSHVSTIEDNPTLVQIFLDLAKYRDYYPLLTVSMELVNRIYTSERNLYTMAVQATILRTTSSITLGKELRRDIALLNRLGAGGLSGEDAGQFADLLRYYTARCYAKSNRATDSVDATEYDCLDPGEEFSCNQQILYNSGIMTIVVNVAITEGQQGCVLSSCFDFLRALAVGFNTVQEKLMGTFDTLLRVVAADEDDVTTPIFACRPWELPCWQESLGNLIAQIFTGCRKTCMQIRPAQVQQILDLLQVHLLHAPTLLDAIDAICKVEEYNLPLKRNQQMTMKTLMLHKETLVNVAYIDDYSQGTMNEKRTQMLRESHDSSTSHGARLLRFHLSLVSLLATTCEGENRDIESICRSIFSLSDLTKTIADPAIPPARKAPYIKYLLWVYLNAAATPAESGADSIETDEDLTLLVAFATVAKDHIRDIYSTPEFSSKDHAAFGFDIFLPCVERLIDRHTPTQGNFAGHALQHVVTIIEHVCHFVENVYGSYIGLEHLNRFRVVDVCKVFDLFRRKLLLPGPVGDTTALKRQVRRLATRCTEILDSFDSGTRDALTNSNEISNVIEEAALNKMFNNFSLNLGTLYQGRNTIRDQLVTIHITPARINKRFVNDHEALEPYTEQIGDDETLPLGPEFQYFARVFVNVASGPHSQAVLDQDSMDCLVRFWRGSLSFQATADFQRRETNRDALIMTLRAVRTVAHNEVILGVDTADLQTQIVKSKAVLPIAELLSTPFQLLQQEVLALSKAILKDGFADTQKAFTNHFLHTREETFFHDIAHMMSMSVSAIKERRELLIQKAAADAARSKLTQTMRTTLGAGGAGAGGNGDAGIENARMNSFLKTVRSTVQQSSTANQNIADDDDDNADVGGRRSSMAAAVARPLSAFERPTLSLVTKHIMNNAAAASAARSDGGVEFEEAGNIRLVFCVLQLMCEGHNAIIQNYLREQPDNSKTYNLVEQVSKFMSVLTDEYLLSRNSSSGEDSLLLLIQCVETLVEFAQGCNPNQSQIYDSGIMDSVNTLLRQTVNSSGFIRTVVPKPQKSAINAEPARGGSPAPTAGGPLKAVGKKFSRGVSVVGAAVGNVGSKVIGAAGAVTGMFFDGDEANKNTMRRNGLSAKLDLLCAMMISAQLATNDPETRKLAAEIDDALDMQQIFRKMREYTIVHEHTEGLEYPDGFTAFDVAMEFYKVVARLNDFTGKKYHLNRPMLRFDRDWREEHNIEFELDQIYLKLQSNTGSIEIMMNGELQQVHFEVSRQMKVQLRAEVKEKLLWSVDRSSVTEGVRDFSEQCKHIIADMNYMDSLLSFSIVTRKLLEWKVPLNRIIRWLSYGINLMMLIVWKAPINSSRTPTPEYYYDWWQKKHVFQVLAWLHVGISALVVISYFLAYPPSTVWARWAGRKIKALFTEPPQGKDDDHDDEPAADKDTPADDLDDDDADEKVIELKTQDGVYKSQLTINKIVSNGLISRQQYGTDTSIFSVMSMYHLVFLAMSVLGPISGGYTFSFHLLHIIIDNQTLSRVILSVTKNGVMLLYVAALVAIIIYIHSLFAFAYVRHNLDKLQGQFCEDLFECFVTSFRMGLLNGGGLGEAYPMETYGFQEPAWRFVFDLSFFVLVTTIGLNIVFGIIVDTFSELRDEKFRTDELMNSQCFICGRKSYDFERFGNGFKQHIKVEHHMWNYLYFFCYLNQKEATEYDAIEQFVATKLFTTSYDFFPTNKALCLKKYDKDNDNDDEVEAQMVSGLDKLLRRSELMLGEFKLLSTRMSVVEAVVNESVGRGVASSGGRASPLRRRSNPSMDGLPPRPHPSSSTAEPLQLQPPPSQPQQPQQPPPDGGGDSSA